LIYLDVTD